MKEDLLNRYYSGDNFRLPALKSRVEPFTRFEYAPRDRRLEVEGTFIYVKQSHPIKPDFYIGYLDSKREYDHLNLKPPPGKQSRILCYIPSNLTSRDNLISTPNIKIKGTVLIDGDKKNTKRLEVDEIEIVPIEYNTVGGPAFDNLDHMFEYIYSRVPDFYENEPKLLFSSLIGSSERDIFFPNENSGCGINIGATREDVPGKNSAHRIKSKDIEKLNKFIKHISIEPPNKIDNTLNWSRFVFHEVPETILSRTSPTINEVNWNISAMIEDMNRGWKHINNFTSSDINVAFSPNILFPEIKKEDRNNIKQTILFTKLIHVDYTKELNAFIEIKTEELITRLAKEVEYAPFLFRYRFKPLCDAFIKGEHMGEYLLPDIYHSEGNLSPSKKDIESFFRGVDNVASEFASFSKGNIDLKQFGNILEDKSVNKRADRKFIDIYNKLLIKGHMTYTQILQYLTEKYELSEQKANSLIGDLKNYEPAIVIERNNGLSPVY